MTTDDIGVVYITSGVLIFFISVLVPLEPFSGKGLIIVGVLGSLVASLLQLVVIFMKNKTFMVGFMLFKEMGVYETMMLSSTGFSFYLAKFSRSRHLVRNYAANSLGCSIGIAIAQFIFSNLFSYLFHCLFNNHIGIGCATSKRGSSLVQRSDGNCR